MSDFVNTVSEKVTALEARIAVLEKKLEGVEEGWVMDVKSFVTNMEQKMRSLRFW